MGSPNHSGQLCYGNQLYPGTPECTTHTPGTCSTCVHFFWSTWELYFLMIMRNQILPPSTVNLKFYNNPFLFSLSGCVNWWTGISSCSAFYIVVALFAQTTAVVLGPHFTRAPTDFINKLGHNCSSWAFLPFLPPPPPPPRPHCPTWFNPENIFEQTSTGEQWKEFSQPYKYVMLSGRFHPPSFSYC